MCVGGGGVRDKLLEEDYSEGNMNESYSSQF